MSTISATEAPHLQQIDLKTFNLQQLGQLKQQIDQELTVFQDSLQTLKVAQNKYQESSVCLEKVTPTSKGREILVPLTDSMYVPGKLAGTGTVLVDIGTGYYVEKDIEDAKDYFKRRVIYVTEQMEKIQMVCMEKNKIKDTTMRIIKMKLSALPQAEGVEKA
ncbi:prefoldin subunit 5 [Venturia canescens]|uniref:prefoldin subunit 5 n=1 Tax=Venturia canescens TaxID=32260 RepID=UPI001C9C5858|nr:prefoldin subunit 5 [Venturia canescens]